MRLIVENLDSINGGPYKGSEFRCQISNAKCCGANSKINRINQAKYNYWKRT